MKILFFIILIAGFGNSVFRREIEDPITLYRLVAPVGFLVVFLMRPRLVIRGLGCFFLFFAYNLALAMLYNPDLSQFWPSIVHYFFLFILLILMIYMKSRYPDFDRSFVRFFEGFYLFLLANLLLESIFGSYYPNLYVDTVGDGSLRAFYWNQNDLAVVLGVASWAVLSDNRYRTVTRVVVVLLTLILLYINDSKAALISMVAVSIPVSIVFRLSATYNIKPAAWHLLLGCAAFFFVCVIAALSDVDIHFANDTYSIRELLIHPVMNVLTLEPTGEHWGSINNRSDAATFVIIEYLKSLGFGLGAGGSWLVLTFPQYKLGGAMSPHNALLQFTVDFGYPVLIGYLGFVVWAARRLFLHRSDNSTRLQVMAILSFPVLGLSQSGAIITNFAFWAGAFYICLLERRSLTEETHPAQGSNRAVSPCATERVLPVTPFPAPDPNPRLKSTLASKLGTETEQNTRPDGRTPPRHRK